MKKKMGWFEPSAWMNLLMFLGFIAVAFLAAILIPLLAKLK
jgi:hypothetical protein